MVSNHASWIMRPVFFGTQCEMLAYCMVAFFMYIATSVANLRELSTNVQKYINYPYFSNFSLQRPFPYNETFTAKLHVNSLDPFLFPRSLEVYVDSFHRPLTRYVKLRVVHAPGMPRTFSPPPRVSDPDMHHGTCVTHMPWRMPCCKPGSLTSGFIWSWWQGKRILRIW